MTVRGSADVQLLMIGGYDVLGQVTEITHTLEALTEETHCLGDSWVENSYVGVRRSEITQRGFYDDGVGSVHEALSTGLSTAKVLTYGLEGTATGAAFVGFSGALEVTYNRTVSRGALHKAEAKYINSGIVEQGKTIRSLKAASASGGQGTALDNGAGASTTGTSGGLPGGAGAGYLQVKSHTNASTVTVSLQSSSDDITYAAICNFTSFSSATVPRAERKAVTTTAIERYVRSFVNYSSVSLGTSTIYFAGLVRGPLPI